MNASPRAIAHYGGVYSVGHEVVLDGSMSFDVDGDVQSYAWAMVSAPLGAEDFENSNSATHSYNLHAIGDYVFQLTVTDDDGATNIGLVEVQALVHDPILLRIDGTKRVKLGQPIPLVASLEPGDATNLSLSWSVVGQPAGAGVFIEGAATATPTLVLDSIGRYEVELQVVTPWASFGTTTNVFVTADQTLAACQFNGADYARLVNRLVYKCLPEFDPGERLLHIFDLNTGTPQQVQLSNPDRFDISPDGLHVAVKHLTVNGGDAVSIVDTATPSDVQTFLDLEGVPMFESSSRVLLGLNTSIRTLNTTTGLVTDDLVGVSFGESILANTEPATIYRFLNFGSLGIETFDASSSPFQSLGNSTAVGTADLCGRLWPSANGEFVVTRCSDVLRVSSDPQAHLTIQTTLPVTNIRHVSHGPSSGRIVVIHGASFPHTIEVFDDSSFASLGIVSLPKVLHPESIEFSDLATQRVFFSADETELVVVGNVANSPFELLGAIVRIALD